MLRVSAIPDHLDLFASADSENLGPLRALDAELAAGSARVRSGCPRLLPAGARLVASIVAHVLGDGATVAAVAKDFRRADLGAFVAGAAASLPAPVRIAMHKSRRTYLRADDRGDGRRVEVIGDLPSAAHVVILIPGMTNAVDNYETQLRPKAMALFDAMQSEAPAGTGVCVIAWLGYNTPDGGPSGLVDAAASRAARSGAEQLRADLALLRSNGLRAHVTVVGHSYGSVVAGRAMRDDGDGPLPVDDVVVVGSPGMDAGSRRALGSAGVRLWAGKTTAGGVPAILHPPGGDVLWLADRAVRVMRGGDPVPMAPVHGPDPAPPVFGAAPLPTDGRGHSDYFSRGSRSLRSIARVAVGRRP